MRAGCPQTKFYVDFPYPSPVSSQWAETLAAAKAMLERYPAEDGVLYLHSPVARQADDGTIIWLPMAQIVQP